MQDDEALRNYFPKLWFQEPPFWDIKGGQRRRSGNVDCCTVQILLNGPSLATNTFSTDTWPRKSKIACLAPGHLCVWVNVFQLSIRWVIHLEGTSALSQQQKHVPQSLFLLQAPWTNGLWALQGDPQKKILSCGRWIGYVPQSHTVKL
jgi:hypothetical protein